MTHFTGIWEFVLRLNSRSDNSSYNPQDILSHTWTGELYSLWKPIPGNSDLIWFRQGRKLACETFGVATFLEPLCLPGY